MVQNPGQSTLVSVVHGLESSIHTAVDGGKNSGFDGFLFACKELEILTGEYRYQ